MFERLREWLGSFKNKVTTAMTFIGGAAATAALLPLPIPTWARIGLGVIAAAAPVVSVVHATAKFAKSRKANTSTENIVESLTSSESADSVSKNKKVADERQALIDSMTDDIRHEDDEEVATQETNISVSEIVAGLTDDEEETTNNSSEARILDGVTDIVASIENAEHNEDGNLVGTLVTDLTAEELEDASDAMAKAAGLTNDEPAPSKRTTRKRHHKVDVKGSRYGRKFNSNAHKVSKVADVNTKLSNFVNDTMFAIPTSEHVRRSNYRDQYRALVSDVR